MFTLILLIYSIYRKLSIKNSVRLKKWLESNRLALNIDKTNFILFYSSSKIITEFIIIKIGRKKIKQENHVCFLGVLLDVTLGWKTHIAELSKNYQEQLACFTR